MRLILAGSGPLLRQNCLALFWILAVSLAPKAEAQEHDEALKQRFLQEAPAQWDQYLQRAEMLQGKIIDHFLNDPADPEVQQFEYKTNGKGKVCTFESKSRKERKENPWDKEVFGTNPRYAFHLRRTTSEGPWALLQLVDLQKESLPETWSMYYDSIFATEATALVRLEAQPFSDIVRSPTFGIKYCKSLSLEGENLVEVSFTFDRAPTVRGRPGHVEGTLLLDPNRFWCRRLADYTVTFANDPKFQRGTGKFRDEVIGETLGSLPVPQLYRNEQEFYQDANTKIRLAYRVECDLHVPSPLPKDEEFTLSAFGLPEPPGLEWKRPTPWYLWLAVAGIACLVSGVAVRRFTRRKATVT
jgi:hypothetical protein